MFVCGTRMPLPTSSSNSPSSPQQDGGSSDGGVEVKVLERHPFTTQTFIPLTANPSKRYLVIVAPSLPPSALDEGLPVPDPSSRSSPSSPSSSSSSSLPGRGMPDLTKLRAFIATGEQAVTYGAGTWHAPMVALGPPGTTVDFLVFQFANDAALEDCQEVALESKTSNGDGSKTKIVVRLAAAAAAAMDSRTSKL
ncbi:Bcdal3 [Apiospora hydei]|uniref:Bcdal3 n=1 Tax=Apiospora hydei TaxID=1337664 RepID=A0ABR1VJL5_9PEZI